MMRHPTFLPTCALLLALSTPAETLGQSGTSGDGEWKISPEAVVVIGNDESGEPLHNVSGAVRLSDGRIVVSDGGLRSRLLTFSPTGSFEGQVGRFGDGPGEFRWITSLQAGPNDSLFVYDGSLQRLTVVSVDGQTWRTAGLRLPVRDLGSDGLSVVERLSDGVWVGRGAQSVRAGPAGKLMRDTVALALMDGTVDDLAVLTLLPGRMTTSTMLMGRAVAHLPSFTPEAIHATWGRCVFASTGEDGRISVYSSDGELLRELTGPGSPREVTEEHLELRHEFNTAQSPGTDPQLLRRLLNAETRPASLPFYHRILTDEWGHIWLQEYAAPEGIGRDWYVLSQHGEELARVTMPHAVRAYEISDAGVLARRVAALGTEHVELFPIRARPSPSASPLPQCVG